MPEATDRRLVALMSGRPVGTVGQDPAGRFSLEYDDTWRSAAGATPLSLSMPLARRLHPDAVVRPFLWGLLPDNERVLERWARTYGVSPGNPFALLRHVGEDCAGAAQLVAPERVEAVLAGDGGVSWLGEKELADRLRTLRADRRPGMCMTAASSASPAPRPRPRCCTTVTTGAGANRGARHRPRTS